ncbi:hypothetical protein ASD65_05430 [Microbacterium sp. Root61]|uniref:HNH endonuclease signature motif containing protein n=1 Tax=Microbacterium sp. Root61 TaxID=1736570 RepID=UPI000700B0A7|nr:HNH endonuclease signature motif containing protein [Microbacterium sp. Root61]KRA23924.1 hypothetical protein ASD65_05430 [Microbacterium sp. Root61]
MAIFSEILEHLEVLRDALGADTASGVLPSQVAALDDDAVVVVITAASGIIRAAEKVRITASGIAAVRSTRESGHGGLAQTRGHHSPVALIQELTGATRADAIKHVRLGESLLTGAGIAGRGDVEVRLDHETHSDTDPIREAWHGALGRALLDGTISSAQHEAILRGLGEPPDTDEHSAYFAEAWSLAAEQLGREAADRTVEELARAARTVRDQLDPEGAQRRYDERSERRSFRLWTDADGVRRASLTFDDLGGAWVQTIVASALRPRRGGPRFVDPTEKAQAEKLVEDARTNEQLAYDLILDVLRAGALADATAVFGTRQAGVRVLVTAQDLQAGLEESPATSLTEDDQLALPAWLIAQRVCDTGTVRCTVDREGNPLDLGREERLFSSKQRIALAVRDGGCRWRGCDRPASYCEAHHIDHYAEGGSTDIDRGILLCRYHHMQLHHGGWRITRDGHADFVLHPPPGRGDPIVLGARLALRYAWRDVDPPPKRLRPAA